MTLENWRPVPGYEGAYEVSDHGGVRSLDRLDSRGRRRRGKPRSRGRQKSGHLTVALCKNGIRRTFQVHQLVLMAFVGPCPEGMEGCHWDDSPANNLLENLRWDTRSANIRDCVRNGGHHFASKTHCPDGHPYTPENTYHYPNGARACNECRGIYRESHQEERRDKGREYMRRKRAVVRSEPKVRTECLRGHPYTEENTYRNGKGRTCLTCKRAQRKKEYEQNRDQFIARAAEWRRANPDRARELAREGTRRYRQRLKEEAAQS